MFITYQELGKYKFEPYKPCPCESGIKYKFCCYLKSKNEKINSNEYNSKRLYFESHKLFKDTDFKMCFGFVKEDCEHGYIDAHSLQNNGVIDKIAEDNHVYYLDMNFDKKTMLPKLEFKKKGKNQASTFYGFCKHHDEIYFSNIEDKPYEDLDEQNFWYAFRAHCFESHRKYRLKKSYSNLFKKFPSATQNLEILGSYRNNELNLKDMELEYCRFKRVYENKSFNEIESFVKVLPFKAGFTATTAVAVNVDLNGNETINIYDYDEKLFVPSVYISVIPKNDETLLIVSRFKEDECYSGFLSALKNNRDDDLLFSYISFCLAEYSENIYFSPKLIDSISNEERNLITNAFLGFLSPTPEARLKNMISTFKLNLFKFTL